MDGGRAHGGDGVAGVRRGVATTPMEVRREVIVRMAVLADELGYEVFSVAEGWGLDSTVLLAEIATRTRRIKLTSGVLSVWGRTPGTIAMAAATLHQISGGRFVLGLGASSRRLVEGWHAMPFARPAERLGRVASEVRGLLAGGRARPAVREAAVHEAVGETAGSGDRVAARGLRLGQPAVADLPIWIAATGEQTIRVAAEQADGWSSIYLRRDRCRELAAEIRHRRTVAALRTTEDTGTDADAQAAPRQPRPLTVAAGPFTVVDADVDSARVVAAACTAFYLAAMGEVYPRLVSSQGLEAEVDLVRAANSAANRGLGVVPDAAQILLDEFTAYGTAADVREQLKPWDAAVDVTMVALPPGLPWPQIEATLRAAAP
ncbi:LLM class flavin-dependent oxidoreductase [Nonomuraea sp. NPDC050328]|uniref:LLM class flavin-dependent oxidoreductase n=1 Tax=Nonomuraea sp. NPDC050328 TaxID=3364361 RepID=UPI00379A043A